MLIPAICTQCGANISVDNSKEAGVCPNCGTAFLTQKAVNNYNTYITKSITIDGETKSGLAESINTASLKIEKEKFQKLYGLEEYDNARKVASSIMEKWSELPDGYAFYIMTFVEYFNYKIDYKGAKKQRSDYTLRQIELGYGWDGIHPMCGVYEKLVKRCTLENRNEFAEVIEKAEAIISDFNAEFPQTLKEKVRRKTMFLAVWSIILAISILCCTIPSTAVLVVSLVIALLLAFPVFVYSVISFLFFRVAAKRLKEISAKL